MMETWSPRDDTIAGIITLTHEDSTIFAGGPIHELYLMPRMNSSGTSTSTAAEEAKDDWTNVWIYCFDVTFLLR